MLFKTFLLLNPSYQTMRDNLSDYYNERANEYDRVYQITEEQNDLSVASKIFQQLFVSRSVLEIACGTGYWTDQIAHTAHSIFATDINESMIAIARRKVDRPNVKFMVGDMFLLQPGESFGGFFGGFIWSHILLQELEFLLSHLLNFVHAGAPVAFIDSRQVAGRAHDAKHTIKTDEFGNTWQHRALENGSAYTVLKNFPSRDFLKDKLSTLCDDLHYIELDHYWIVTAKAKKV